MFERAVKGLEVAADLAVLRVRLAHRALGRMVSATGGAVLAGVLAAAGILGFLGALYFSVSPSLGRSASLLIVSGVALLLALAIWLVSLRHAHGWSRFIKENELRGEAAQAEARLRTVLGLADDESTEEQTPGVVEGDWKSEALMSGLSNPQAIASAGFALVSLLGPSRIIRLVRFSATSATLATLLTRALLGASQMPRHSPGKVPITLRNNPSISFCVFEPILLA